ncbi:2-amino-4-hydroxy-6-hydroxymethyldihydropteridinepyrophosphokinase [Ruegeria sp. THAF57]|uniref:2-amino-4-hydroxy-6- hydroxymethyldihydropteridine diphosphokinase n=1 Tax=Ruegeria sp. THAF57 TaxID=2744555 RepID=UPI0015DDF6EC|nr:2-amino-4-hydroxy-6-hydroxymethyldihydropteridine diphosphokinase [Ruegeria sp. THAF57]CAD0186429.1 2-amino-4-hydroxy-6-hydroxymethyldihydropteridinepyrophosphokinase [Ruegeria sp. THAF57]
MRKFSSKVVIALGANLNLRDQGPKVTLEKALDAIPRQGVVIRAVSRFFETPCFPAGAGPDYVNAAALIEADKTPAELLHLLHEVEHDHGRQRVQRWGMRTLDLDLVCYDDQVLPDRDGYERWRTLSAEDQKQQTPDQLILPHPRLQDRAFVLVPMADIAPDWRHPVLGRTVSEMLADLPADDVAAVTPM